MINEVHRDTFQRACRTAEIDELARLISEEKFLVNESMFNFVDEAPLLTAISEGSLEVAALLLKNGVNPNLQDGLPLRDAVTKNLEMVRCLINHGAAVDMRCLNSALHAGRYDVVRLLLDHIGDRWTDDDPKFLLAVLEAGQIDLAHRILEISSNPSSYNKDVIVLTALRLGNVEFVRLLLVRGAVVKLKNIKQYLETIEEYVDSENREEMRSLIFGRAVLARHL